MDLPTTSDPPADVTSKEKDYDNNKEDETNKVTVINISPENITSGEFKNTSEDKDEKHDTLNSSHEDLADMEVSDESTLKDETKIEVEGDETKIEVVDDETKNVEVPLLKDDSINIDVELEDKEGNENPTLPIKKKKSIEDVDDLEPPHKEKIPMYLFPITRMKLAWTRSSNIIEFVFLAIGIMFSTLGWLFCVGGIPFIALASLIIGSIYVYDCPIQPNIPVYLIVSGVFGTIQHFIAVWTKYLPKSAQGRIKVYRAYCKVLDRTFHLFLLIWFILGCIWVYGVHSDVYFDEWYEQEYCDKTLYYFAFWLLNFSFFMLSLLVVASFVGILYMVTQVKKDKKGVLQ